MVASASDDHTVGLFDTLTGAALRTLKGHTDSVHTVAFSPDGNMVASASSDKTVRLWDTVTGAALQTLHGCIVYQHSFSRDGLCIKTDRGMLNIPSDPISVLALKPNPSCTAFVRGSWISQGQRNRLWLPIEYRPSVMKTIRDSGGTGVVSCRRRGTRPNPFIYSSPMSLGAGGGKLRVLYAICRIVS